jgi:signal transduction histidine kinase
VAVANPVAELIDVTHRYGSVTALAGVSLTGADAGPRLAAPLGGAGSRCNSLLPVRPGTGPVGEPGGGANIHFAEMRRKDATLRVAHQAVEEMARIAERERIGRDLHDLLGHTLSVIVLKSELASRLAESEPARAATEIRDVERICRDALAEVRKAVRGYGSEGLLDETRS